MEKRKIPPLGIIQSELQSDEQLLWQGKPIPKPYVLRHSKWGEFVAGIIFGSLSLAAVIWLLIPHDGVSLISAPRTPDEPSVIFKLIFFMVPLFAFLLGLKGVAAPLFAYIEAKQTTYALTTKRAIILLKMQTKQVKSYYSAQLQQRKIREYENDIGDIVLGKRTVFYKTKYGQKSYHIEEGFFTIPDVQEVDSIMSEIIESIKAKPKLKVVPPPPVEEEIKEDNLTDEERAALKLQDVSLSWQELNELEKLQGRFEFKKPGKRLVLYGYVDKIRSRDEFYYGITEKGKKALKQFTDT